MKHLAISSMLGMLWVTGCASFAVPDSDSVPENPTWEDPVAEVLANHCVRCHGDNPDRGAPDYFTLEQWQTVDGPMGAADMARSIVDEVESGEMPPAAPLGANDTEILRRWEAAGAPLNALGTLPL